MKQLNNQLKDLYEESIKNIVQTGKRQKRYQRIVKRYDGQRKKIQCTYNQMKEQLERMSEWQLSLKVAEKISRINERYQPTHGFRKPES